jgi:hypothetical protein
MKNKKLLIVAVAAVFIFIAMAVVTVAGYFILFSGSTTLRTQKQQDEFMDKAVKAFKKNGEKLKMEGTLTLTNNDKKIKLDVNLAMNKSDSSMSMKSGSTEFNNIVLKNDWYMNDGSSTWYKFPNDTTNSSSLNVINPKGLLEDGKAKYEYKKLEKCGVNKCQVFDVTEDTDKSVWYINSRNYHIEKIVLNSSSSKGTFTVSYGDPHIKAPSKSTSLTGEEASNKMMEILLGFFSKLGDSL